MRFFMFFINLIFWLWAFLVPAATLSAIGWWLYYDSAENLFIAILLTILGVIIGVWIAESIRRKKGLAEFFGSIMASPDVKDRGIASTEDEPKN